MAPSLRELTGEDLFDPVDLSRHVCGGDPGDVGDGDSVETVEVQEDDLTVDGLKLLNQTVEPLHSDLPVNRGLGVREVRQVLEVVEGDQHPCVSAAMLDDMRSPDIVCHPVDPCPERALAIERRQAPPGRKMNLLEKIAPFLRVGFVRSCKALESCAEGAEYLLVEIVLRH